MAIGNRRRPLATVGDHRRNEEASLVRDDTCLVDHGNDYLFMAQVGVVSAGSRSSQHSSKIWLIDSNVMHHMAHTKPYFFNFQLIKPVDVHLANNGTAELIGCGDVR